MSRIISDTYIKQNKQTWGDDPNSLFNRRILAVNNMYGWLYEKGILEKVSFVFKDYDGTAYFALNASDLLPYRKEMEKAQIDGAALAVRNIFDEPYTPCVYSGAIELGWTMSTYRSVDGMVGRSWECGMIQHLNTEGIYKISDIRDKLGVKAAVKALYDQFDWNLTIPEQKRYRVALDYFNLDTQINIENDHVKKYGRELIYCHEHGKTLSDFDFWTCYEELFDEKLTYDEYIAVDSSYDGDPHEIAPDNTEIISELKSNLKNYRDSVIRVSEEEMKDMYTRASEKIQRESKAVFESLADKIQFASSKLDPQHPKDNKSNPLER